MTNLEYARRCWERENWGDPADDLQQERWVAFFTDSQIQEDEFSHSSGSWTRPRRWIEDLVRGNWSVYPTPATGDCEAVAPKDVARSSAAVSASREPDA